MSNARQAPYPTLTPTQSPTPTPTGTPQQGWERASYTYSSTHPHAVTSVERMAGTDTFGYDAVGSMTSRLESGVSWTQTFNAEGRLSQISDGSDTWAFTHDGDGVRLKQANPDGTTTLFLGGGLYEVTVAGDGSTSSVKRYYALVGQRVLRDGEGLHYLLTDHLDSIVGVLDGSGGLESEQRYLPYGGSRFSPDVAETDFAFTGQRNLEVVGLMDYNARWYSPSVGRFISSDLIVPNIADIQMFNKYSYVRNNPLRFTDPSGHRLRWDAGGGVIEKPCEDQNGNGICDVFEVTGEDGNDPDTPIETYQDQDNLSEERITITIDSRDRL